MKLTIEIRESLNHGKYVYGIRSLITTDEREGDEIYDKEYQSGEVARLIGLSERIEETVKSFCYNDTTPNASLSSAKDNLVRII